MSNQLKHDALFKKIMVNQIAAQEFLEHYLPEEVKEIVDLSKITIEKESFVEDDLKRALSDLVYSVKTKDNEQAFVYVLIEAEVRPNYWMALKLWKYMLLLAERHKKGRNKLPLIIPMVFYHGTRRFNVPKNLFELFSDPKLAKQLMCEDYKLIDLQAMSDDEIKQKQHFGMLEYMLKYIKQRDILKLWDELLTNFKPYISIDKSTGYIYIRSFLWYSDAKIEEGKQQELEGLIASHLTATEEENIMRTIAEKYIDEGVEKGIVQGIQVGKAEGIQVGKAEGIEIGEAKGKAEERVEIAKKMLVQGSDFAFISAVTGLDKSFIQSLAQKK
ncbi:Rpn family recombination-promoting nuclease/putative transposase [Candidatus Tisiphia endosymbiont of Metellina segmentata]|uniref:Rpn family recombination-promoting nuclease/putative transposase n=1 Tax=Candidatus Tisiphia endosymbiont of Metellina segmentata TaxID=3066274 RepID=UPI00313D6F63